MCPHRRNSASPPLFFSVTLLPFDNYVDKNERCILDCYKGWYRIMTFVVVCRECRSSFDRRRRNPSSFKLRAHYHGHSFSNLYYIGTILNKPDNRFTVLTEPVFTPLQQYCRTFLSYLHCIPPGKVQWIWVMNKLSTRSYCAHNPLHAAQAQTHLISL